MYDLQTLCIDSIIPRIPSLLRNPSFHALPYQLREKIFQYITGNKLLYMFPDVAEVVGFFVHEELEQFDLAKNGIYVNDAVVEKLQCCTKLQSLSFRKNYGISKGCLENLVTKLPLLNKIQLSSLACITDELLEKIGKYCANLIDLAILRCDSITDKGLCAYASNCTGKLDSVSFFGCSTLSDPGLESVFAANPYLRSVNVSRIPSINTSISYLLSHNTSLTELLIPKCHKVTAETLGALTKPPLCETMLFLDFSMLRIPEPTLINVLSACTNLQTLYLPNCPNVTSNVTQCIGRSCISLKKLYIARNPLVHPALDQISQSCHELEVLNATSCGAVIDQVLLQFANSCSGITTLYFGSCNFGKPSLKTLLQHCPLLTSLDVSSCDQTVDDEIMNTVATECKKMKYLDVTDCSAISHAGFCALARGLPDLDSLSMAFTFASDDSLIALAEGVCKRITTINVSGCTRITPKFLPTLLHSQRSLTKLYASSPTLHNDRNAPHNPPTHPNTMLTLPPAPYDLKNMTSEWKAKRGWTVTPPPYPHQSLEALFFSDWDKGVDMDTMRLVLPYCLNLEVLILSGCLQVNDEVLAAVADTCKSLLYLDISMVQNVSDKGITAIATNCHLLQNLIAYGCKMITDVSLQGLIKNCPMLVELTIPFSAVSDAAILETKKLPFLNKLNVRETLVSRSMVNILKAALPKTTIIR